LTLTGLSTLSGHRAHNLSGCEAADRVHACSLSPKKAFTIHVPVKNQLDAVVSAIYAAFSNLPPVFRTFSQYQPNYLIINSVFLFLGVALRKTGEKRASTGEGYPILF